MAADDFAILISIAGPADDEAVAHLLDSYVTEANPQLLELTGRTIVQTDIDEARRWVAASRAEAATILLATHHGSPIGTATLRQLEPGVAEIKRIFVLRTFRGRRVGAALMDALLDASRRRGFGVVRLDSASFQRRAHALYRDRGFTERAPYPGSEIPPELFDAWCFFEVTLT